MTALRTASTYAHPLLLLVLVLSLVLTCHGYPQALRVQEELPVTDHRWDPPTLPDQEVNKLVEISKSFRASKSLDRALTEVLETLSDEELRVLEKTLLPTEEMQGDMPMEDLVDDGPQELPGEEEDDMMTGYRGELLVLDNVNASTNNNYSEPDDLYPHQLQKLNREKVKEMRLATIKNQILNILWPVGSPPNMRGNMTLPQPPKQDLLRILLKNQQNSVTPDDVYTEKIQSFYPSCGVPRNTDAELWNEGDAMNLLFDLTYPSSLQGTQVNIVAAKLRLYKLSMNNMTVSAEETPSEEDSANTPLSEDRMIRVSVYWYTRSLKKHRVKRKLLDSQMVSAYKEAWTEWNIRGAVKSWRDSGRNFGLAVVVEDEDGNLLPTEKYFAPMNCSQEASTSRPIPGFLLARALSPDGSDSPDTTFSQALQMETMPFPMIDLCTVELPEYDQPESALYHRFVDTDNVRRQFRRLQQQNTSEAPDTDRHRLRHNSQKQKEDTHHSTAHSHRHLQTVRRDDGDSVEEITWADDLDGHQLRKQIIVQKVIRKKQNDQDGDR